MKTKKGLERWGMRRLSPFGRLAYDRIYHLITENKLCKYRETEIERDKHVKEMRPESVIFFVLTLN